MSYLISDLAALAGVSARTLRYYDQIGLLHSTGKTSSGYRQYDEEAVLRLQQICFFKQFNLPLKQIGLIMRLPLSEREEQLRMHRHLLVDQQRQLTQLIATLDAALQLNQQGGSIMTDEKKFAAFKQTQVTQNVHDFGSEVTEKWGYAALADANQQYLGLSQKDMADARAIETEMLDKLVLVIDSKDENSGMAREVVKLHRKWLNYFWPSYSPLAHKGLGELYVSDLRFKNYYRDKSKRDRAAIVLNSLIQRYA
ncbi:transcriptional activator TipA [Furfurilactobacillus rossiae]|uniref:MerR family transcriptional regulator n=1 Tax=Furfurilactobacillus rossiae TaxID=231049 RepID=UPI0015BEDBDA|nr:MerR family transcriptional regulator [Furfurilactobacillus rossiae]MCF6165999.1 MerR family transcriptional regulator [Furfurilactobacillus rossiae]QLE62977.1 transcriptional activator TipA [Furfurilactobacillus rossiae]